MLHRRINHPAYNTIQPKRYQRRVGADPLTMRAAPLRPARRRRHLFMPRPGRIQEPSQREPAPRRTPAPLRKLRAKHSTASRLPAGPIRLSIGEPQHATPAFIRQSLIDNLGGLPATRPPRGPTPAPVHRQLARAPLGLPWSTATQVLPVNGTREALFAFAQCVIDGSRPDALVLCPNPFYQIYEGAALARRQRRADFINNLPGQRFRVPTRGGARVGATWRDVQLVFVCSPGNPTGRLLSLTNGRRCSSCPTVTAS